MAEQARDVVCGMSVDPATAGASAHFEGETYYFCCAGCKRAFERDPGKYIDVGNARQHPTQAA